MSSNSAPLILIAAAAVIGGAYLLMQRSQESNVKYDPKAEAWKRTHTNYIATIEQAYINSNGTEADLDKQVNILLKSQSSKLLAIAQSRTKADYSDYGNQIKQVYHEYYDLHTLKL